MAEYNDSTNHHNQRSRNCNFALLVYVDIVMWINARGRSGRDHMVGGFTPAYGISAYHH